MRHISAILRLFLVMISTESCRVSLDIVPGYAYKLQCRRTTYLSDYPAPAYHHTTTVRIVLWIPTTYIESTNVRHISADFVPFLGHDFD